MGARSSLPAPLSKDIVATISTNYYYLLSKVGAQREIGNVRRSRGRGNLNAIMPTLSVFNMQNADENFPGEGSEMPSHPHSARNL